MRHVFLASVCYITLIAALPHSLAAQGRIVPRPCAVRILPVDDRAPAPARDCQANIARSASQVRVELSDRVLQYEVDERFINRGGTIGEADYLFPLPNGAAFQDLELSIDGQLVSGEMMGASEARRIYEDIVRRQRDPALVEWMGHGLVRARIFPINPGETKRVVVRFQSVAPREGDALRVDYFRAAAPSVARTDQTATPRHDSTASSFVLTYRQRAELGTPYSPTHGLDVTDRDGRRSVAVRGDAKDVTILIPARKSAEASIAMLPHAPGNEEGFALITVSPPAARRAAPMPRDVTLVLDVSGSMSGRKMEQARAAGRQLLETLRPIDRFRLIDFSSDAHTFRDEFVPASPENRRAAARYFDALEASGGTNIEGALREALRTSTPTGRLSVVLFVTDGEATIGERSADALAAIASSTRRGSRIFTFGLGADVNVALLEQLALDGRGTSQFVRPDESVERMVGIVAERLVDPVLTDVRIHVDGDVRLTRMLPAAPADIFADRDLVLFARYSGHGTARLTVEGNSRGEAVRWASTVEFPERERANPFVARLWATQRVGFLSAEKRRNGANAEVDDEIRSLGERYGIPTEFTSYLVVEPRVALNGRASGAAASSMSPAPAREQRFEAAKAASAQRSVVSAVAVDSMAAVDRVARDGAGSEIRRVDGHTFELRDGVWVDSRYRASLERTVVRPFSPAYFALVAELPELRSPFALGARVVVVGRARAIELADTGVTTLSPSALAALTRSW